MTLLALVADDRGVRPARLDVHYVDDAIANDDRHQTVGGAEVEADDHASPPDGILQLLDFAGQREQRAVEELLGDLRRTVPQGVKAIGQQVDLAAEPPDDSSSQCLVVVGHVALVDHPVVALGREFLLQSHHVGRERLRASERRPARDPWRLVVRLGAWSPDSKRAARLALQSCDLSIAGERSEQGSSRRQSRARRDRG